jgi:hypothetical protein
MEATGSSRTNGEFHWSIRHYNPEHRNLQMLLLQILSWTLCIETPLMNTEIAVLFSGHYRGFLPILFEKMSGLGDITSVSVIFHNASRHCNTALKSISATEKLCFQNNDLIKSKGIYYPLHACCDTNKGWCPQHEEASYLYTLPHVRTVYFTATFSLYKKMTNSSN